jgi:hypothetical protein
VARKTLSSQTELPLIRASELAQYSFCQRAWWLGTVKGIPSQNQASLTRGVAAHNRHHQQVRAALGWRYASFFLWGSGGIALIAATAWYLLG